MSQNSRAKDRLPFQFEGLRRPLGGGLGPPKPKPSYVPATDAMLNAAMYAACMSCRQKLGLSTQMSTMRWMCGVKQNEKKKSEELR